MSNNIGSDADAYQQQLINLTPPGQAFPTESNSTWVKFLGVLAQTFARIDANAVLLIDESFPDTTTILLPNWERIAGLPDDCSDVLGDTFAIRRQNLIAKLSARGGQTKNYLIVIAAKIGFDITITEYDPFRVDINAVEDALNSTEWQFAFLVTAPTQTITWFRASAASAGEPLAIWGNERLECIINKYKPAHTIALFAYV